MTGKQSAGPVAGTGTHVSVGGAEFMVPVADDPRDELARLIDGTFVVVVKEATGGRYRRRAFLTAAAAEKAATKATRAGHNATVYLAELRPVWKMIGGAS